MTIQKKPANVDEYISGFPEHTQRLLRQIRTTIQEVAPDATEAISYGIPTFNYKGTYLVYFAGYKNHVSVYPAPRGKAPFDKILAPYKGGVGTVQFPLDQPLPVEIIKQIVQFRMKN